MDHGADGNPVEFVELGYQPGPALPLALDARHAAVSAAVSLVRRRRARTGWLPVAAAVPLAFALIGAATAAVTTYMERRAASAASASQPPVAVRPPKRPVRTAQEHAVPTAVEPAPSAGTLDAAETSPSPARVRDLLKQANALRAQAQYARAERLYARVARTAPVPDDAYAATVAAAALRLEHLHDPRGALALFRGALVKKPRGPLAEEARFGIANCYRELGDAAAEARALATFLDRHPDSVLQNRARARLALLGPALE